MLSAVSVCLGHLTSLCEVSPKLSSFARSRETDLLLAVGQQSPSSLSPFLHHPSTHSTCPHPCYSKTASRSPKSIEVLESLKVGPPWPPGSGCRSWLSATTEALGAFESSRWGSLSGVQGCGRWMEIGSGEHGKMGFWIGG